MKGGLPKKSSEYIGPFCFVVIGVVYENLQ